MKLRIEHDEFPESPRDWDNVGTMVCWHNRYNLGDEQPNEDPEEWLNNLADSFLGDIPERVAEVVNHFYYFKTYNDYGMRRPGHVAEAYLKRKREEVIDRDIIQLSLYLYDHSGITMSTSGFSCPWDSGQVGYIYMTLEQARKEWSGTDAEIRAKALACLEAEVKVYDDYLTGEVYGYVIEDDDGEEIDSCWGFYGEEDCEQSGQAALEYLTKRAA